MIDLLVSGGKLVDPFSGRAGDFSVGMDGGRIAGIYPSGAAPKSRDAYDAKGRFVSPGWIDLHAHVYPEKTPLGIEADAAGARRGVTTVVDAGSAGCDTFAQFVEDAIAPSQTRVLAWLNIAGKGLTEGLAELADPADIDARKTARCVRENDMIRGVKARMSGSALGQSGLEPLKKAKEAARLASCPVMVHIGNGPPKLEQILALLGPGDVVTHAFHGKPGGCFDENGRAKKALTDALRRGVLLDVGHGSSSFAFKRLEAALAQGIWPNTISTDIYRANCDGPVYSLARTMEKCIALGVPPTAAIAAVTTRPAAALGLPELCDLRHGSPADLTVFSLADERADYADAEGEKRTGKLRIRVCAAIKGGKVWEYEH